MMTAYGKPDLLGNSVPGGTIPDWRGICIKKKKKKWEQYVSIEIWDRENNIYSC